MQYSIYLQRYRMSIMLREGQSCSEINKGLAAERVIKRLKEHAERESVEAG